MNDQTGDPIRYGDGKPLVTATDLFSYGFGSRLGIDRSWGDRTSSGIAGPGWVFNSLPYVIDATYTDSTSGTHHAVAVSSGGGAQQWFDESGGSYTALLNNHNTLVATGGEYILTSTDGTKTIFYDLTTGSTAGKFKRQIGAYGVETSTTYNGGNVSELTRSYFDGTNSVKESFLFEFIDTGLVNAGLVRDVIMRRKSWVGGPGSFPGWTTGDQIRRADYGYYPSGPGGLLRTASISTVASALTPASITNSGTTATVTLTSHGFAVGDIFTIDGATQGAYNGTFTVASVVDSGHFTYVMTDNPGATASGTIHLNKPFDVSLYRYDGTSGLLSYVVNPEAYARVDAAYSNPLDPGIVSDPVLGTYADNHFEYDVYRRATKEVAADTNFGNETLAYTPNSAADPNPDSIDFNVWREKVVQTRPSGDQYTIYVNEVGMPMLKVFSPSGGGSPQATFYKYDSGGRLILSANEKAVNLPASLTTLEGFSDLLDSISGNYYYLSDTDGQVTTYSYYSGTDTAGATTAGDVNGYLKQVSVSNGETGTAIPQTATSYYKISNGSTGTNLATIVPVALETVYSGTNSTGARTTNYSYTFAANTNTAIVPLLSMTMQLPAITTANNGPGTNSADTITTFFDALGLTEWIKDGDGYFNYIAHDVGTGSVLKTIVDVRTGGTNAATYADLPSGWSNTNGAHLTTSMLVDSLGRTTKLTDPNSKNTFSVYNDTRHEVRTYNGFDGTNTTGPIELVRFDRAGSYVESLTMSATPTTTGGVPTGLETIAASNIQSLSRSFMTKAGKVDRTDDYFSLSGQTYTTGALGTSGTHYLETSYGYNSNGLANKVLSPDGTIHRTVYDGLDRVTKEWIGTNDTSASDSDPTGGGAVGNNMLQVSQYTYDLDSNLTESRAYFGTNAADYYATAYAYDFRDRLTDERGPDNVAVKYTLDNLGEATRTDTYADKDQDFVIDGVSGTNGGELRGRVDAAFDEQGRVFRSTTFNVDPSLGTNGGTVGNGLTTNVWRNHRGFVIKVAQANGLFSKQAYDGAGRNTANFVGFDTTDNELANGTAATTYDGAGNVSGDTILSQAKMIYDNAGNLVTTVTYARLENDTTTTGALGAATNQAWTQVGVNWYDAANRLIASANYGRDNTYVFNSSGTLIDADSDGIPDEAENTARAPNTSDNYIVTKYEYDSGGRLNKVTDNLGHANVTTFDLLGRTTATIENYVNGIVADSETDTDRTTLYAYDSSGRMNKMTARNPKGSGLGIDDQDTKYLFNSTINASWATSVIYPDSSDTTSSGTDQVKYTFDRLGRVLTKTDQRGVVHTYSYDSAGRQSLDAVTTLPSGVDGAIRAIGETFDDVGRALNITSYAGTTTASTVVNDLKYTYDGWGNVIKSEQAHDGVVGSTSNSGTKTLQYFFDDGATGTNAAYVRLSKVIYPGTNRSVFYNYGSGTTTSGLLNLYDNIADSAAGTTKYAQYTYLGDGTMTKVTHPAVSGGLVLSYGSGGTYAGWDRFGRIIRNEWKNDAATAIRDGYVYTYDRNSNRMSKDVTSTSAPTNFDETYSYDGLDRLATFKRGTLASGSITGTNVAFTQDWTGGSNALDSLGNTRSYNNNGTTQTRTHNKANETTGITGGSWIVPTYDAAGNTLSAPKGSSETTRVWFTYDAWNRIVNTKNDSAGSPGSVAASYEYDGLNHRIEKTIGGSTYDGYYNENWQLIEVRKADIVNPSEQYVWDSRYIDAPVVRFYDSNQDGDYIDAADNTLYYVTDAAQNVTGVIDQSTGTVSERYVFDPYGKPIFYNGTWTPISGTAKSTNLFFGGYLYDGESGLYYIRERYYHPTLGKWMQRDFAGYIDGGNLYEYVRSNPGNGVDPLGLNVKSDSAGSQPLGAFPTVTAPPAGSKFNALPANNATDPAWQNSVAGIISESGTPPSAYPNPNPNQPGIQGVPSPSNVIEQEIVDYQYAEALADSTEKAYYRDKWTRLKTPKGFLEVVDELKWAAAAMYVGVANNMPSSSVPCQTNSSVVPKAAPENAGAGYGTSNAQAQNLARQLTSEEQMGQALSGQGTPLIGAGTDKALLDANRLAQQYGGNPGDWAKMGSESSAAHGVQTPAGNNFETHWYQNGNTVHVVEIKTKIAGH